MTDEQRKAIIAALDRAIALNEEMIRRLHNVTIAAAKILLAGDKMGGA